jgi:DNA-binding NtrC family response regulator
MPRVLVVDDDMFFRKVITKLLTGHGYEITLAGGGEEALQTLQTQAFDLMISDVNMTPMDGMELLEKVRERYPDMGVIMLTGHDEIEIAIEAMKKGAFDFLVKPFQLDDLFATVQRSLEYYNISPEKKPIAARLNGLEGLISNSDSMHKVCDMIRRVAPANVTVLLSGEPGTEKEVIARALHYYSSRKDLAFEAFDCSALPSKSEKTATGESFSPALQSVFASAKGGTVFLGHIEAMPLDLQARLLGVVQSGKPCKTCGALDVRLVVATSRDLEAMARRGEFNENLYYRLSALEIEIPPLHTRQEDLPLLVEQSLHQQGTPGQPVPVLDAAVREILYSYTWPGNVAELDAAIGHALAQVKNGVITQEMLPERLVEAFHEGVRSNVIINRRDQIKGQAFKNFLHAKREALLNRTAEAGTSNDDSETDPSSAPLRIKG